jgi:hypothetical protein
MSYEIMTEDEEGIPIGTSQGWPDFCDWAVKTGEDNYPELVAFADEGITYAHKDLATELKAALKEEPPKDDVAATARDVLKFVEGHADAELIMVVNGLTGGK